MNVVSTAIDSGSGYEAAEKPLGAVILSMDSQTQAIHAQNDSREAFFRSLCILA